MISFAVTLCLTLTYLLTGHEAARAQIRLSSIPRSEGSKPAARVHPEDLTPTTLALDLCVDGSAMYACPNPITSDSVYIPAIALTYGQVLDGVVSYGTSDGSPLNTGTITIYKDTDPVCVLVIGVDTMCPPNSTVFDAGNYTISATLTFPPGSSYANFDTNVGPCSATPTCDVVVSVAKDTASIALRSSASPAALGTAVTFTATVTGGYPATPTGAVVFDIDGAAVPAVTLNGSGAASYTTSTLTLGMHTIAASYAGAIDFLPADEDATLKQQIVPPVTMTTIASSLNPSNVGDNVTFTSTVASASSLGAVPTGAVTFKDGTASFATVLVTPKGTQNVAQTSIATLGAGTHSITAIYSGDAATSASVSPVLVQQVDYPLTMPPEGYTLTVTPSPLTIVAGLTANLTVTVTPVSGFAGSVALSCSDLPAEAACLFGEAAIPVGGGTTTLALSTTAPHDCGSNVPYGGYGALLHRPFTFGKSVGYAGGVLAGALLFFFPRPGKFSRGMRGFFALAVACGLASLAGCGSGNCTDFGTAPGHYTLKVVGSIPLTMPVTTAVSPKADGNIAETQTTNVALTVKP